MSSDVNQVDVRGPRFAAWITSTVLLLTLVVSVFSHPAATVLLSAQAIVFAVSAARGPRNSPYGLVYAKLVAPRLSPVSEREPVAPLKFAQMLGLFFAVIGVIGFAAGLPLVGVVATAFALFASFLNAAFGICLGCQIYPLVARFRRAPAA